MCAIRAIINRGATSEKVQCFWLLRDNHPGWWTRAARRKKKLIKKLPRNILRVRGGGGGADGKKSRFPLPSETSPAGQDTRFERGTPSLTDRGDLSGDPRAIVGLTLFNRFLSCRSRRCKSPRNQRVTLHSSVQRSPIPFRPTTPAGGVGQVNPVPAEAGGLLHELLSSSTTSS